MYAKNAENLQLVGENGIAFEARAKSFFPSVVAVEIVTAQHFIELKRNISKQFECASPKIIFHFVGNLWNRKSVCVSDTRTPIYRLTLPRFFFKIWIFQYLYKHSANYVMLWIECVAIY